MTYLLDTELCIYLIKNKPAVVISRLSELSVNEVALSAISVFELQFGVENSQHRKRAQQALIHFLEPFNQVLPVDRQVAGAAAKIRSDLKKGGTPIGPFDLLIAAVAVTHELILVSNNVREFKRVRGLRVENWTV